MGSYRWRANMDLEIRRDLAKFIAAGRIPCTIDRVSGKGVIETNPRFYPPLGAAPLSGAWMSSVSRAPLFVGSSFEAPVGGCAGD